LREVRFRLNLVPEGERSSAWGWPAWVARGFAAGLCLGLARLGVGVWAVRVSWRRSRAIADPGLVAEVEALRGELGVVAPVEVREAGEFDSPATIGWRNPAILLPGDWRGWDDRERRAVLAHELAHVLGGDYRAGLIAQVGLALHFYHPLAHLLAGRLRLHQELAADARAARLAGGRLAYLSTLAGLALRAGPKPAAWPARPFLPTRGTFMRRIEMLRDPNAPPPAPWPRRGRALTVTALVAAGLIVAGFRGPAAPAQAPAPARDVGPAKAEASTRVPDLDPASLPDDVRFVLDVRPAEILRKRPEWARFAESFDAGQPGGPVGFRARDVEQILVLGIDRQGEQPPPGEVLLFRSSRPIDAKDVSSPGSVEVRFEGGSYFKSANAPGVVCTRLLDDRTQLVGSEADMKRPPIGAGQGRGRHSWDDAWNKAGPGQVRSAFDRAWVKRVYAPTTRPGGPDPLAMFAPLFEEARAYGIGLDASDGLALDLSADCEPGRGAEHVAATLMAALTLSRNALPEIGRSVMPHPAYGKATVAAFTDGLGKFLDSANIERDGDRVRLRSKLDLAPLDSAVQALDRTIQANRAEAARFAAQSNMRQVALALAGYQNANGSFPPAVLFGPDGVTPHSWRVAILPYLGEDALYSRYKFDEPWDGPGNRKLLDKMPRVFAGPRTPAGATTPGYFVLTGPDTLFPVRREGVRLPEITDGTSATILVVEANRDIPWTKPEDIPYDARKPLPELGSDPREGFHAALADGSTRFFKATLDPRTLRGLVTRNGGEAILPLPE